MTHSNYPTKSAGPCFPAAPVQHAVLRIIPGDTRRKLPALQGLGLLAGGVHLRATDGKESATIGLDDVSGFAVQFWEFEAPEEFLTVTCSLLGHCDVGNVIFLKGEFEGERGVICRPVIDARGVPVASLTVEYLVIRPGPKGFRKKGERYVPKFVGHRGMGSCGSGAGWRPLENVPASFLKAAGKGGEVECVELDVQLSRDGKTVIYHDWCLRPGGERDKSKKKGVLKVPIYNMTFGEFDEEYRKLYGHMRMKDEEMEREYGEKVMEIRLRSLGELCEEMPEHVGMLVEVKYPSPNVKEDEMLTCAGKNELCDAVLKDLFEKGGGRKVMLLSFDADLCLLLKLKQDSFPVYFLHCEVMDKPCDMTDPRTIDLEQGIKFARATGLEGMVLFNELALLKKDMVKEALQGRLAVLTYGGKNTHVDCVREQFAMGVNGVIADDVLDLVEAFGNEK